jgi:hypothetical protein
LSISFSTEKKSTFTPSCPPFKIPLEATKTRQWRTWKVPTTHQAEIATVAPEARELVRLEAISGKKAQSPEKEVRMAAERRFCPFVSQTASWRGNITAQVRAALEVIDESP